MSQVLSRAAAVPVVPLLPRNRLFHVEQTRELLSLSSRLPGRDTFVAAGGASLSAVPGRAHSAGATAEPLLRALCHTGRAHLCPLLQHAAAGGVSAARRAPSGAGARLRPVGRGLFFPDRNEGQPCLDGGRAA